MKLTTPVSRVHRHTINWGWLVFVFAIILTAPLASVAQVSTATILGSVTDPSGAAVPSVTVNVTDVDTNQTTHYTTNGSGQYVAPDLPIGHYTVQVQAPNFQQASASNISLSVGDRRRVDFQLKLGASQQTVTVEATPVAVQSDTGEQSYVVTGQQVTQLATNGRSMYTLEALVPGASSMQSDFQVPTSTGGDAGVSFNGLRMGHNLWLVDGGETDDRGGAGGSDVMPSMDAIAEFRTLTSNYSAEYGLSSGGTMSLVIKSGTKQVHGEAWYFGRNDALDARNYFNPAHSFDPATGLTKSNRVAELRFHTFGFNIGGPLTLHPHGSNPKTFFFYNMEWRRLIQGQTLNQTVPLTSEYPGANGAGTGAVFPTGTNGGTITVPSNVPTSLLFRNCGGAAPPGVTPGQPFPNNTIPACMIDPNAAALLAAGIFPAPTQGNQFIGGNNAPTNVREEVIRLDHTFTDKFSVFGHFIADQVNQTYGTTQWSADNVPTVFDTFKNPGYAAVIHVTNIIHPNLLNEVQFNYNGNRINIFPAGVYKAPPSFTFNRVFANTSANA